MLPYEIKVYPTYVSVPCDTFGYTPDGARLKDTIFELTYKDYDKFGNVETSNIYTAYDTKNEMRRFPRHALALLERELKSQNSQYTVVPGETIEPQFADIQMSPLFEADPEMKELQASTIEFLLNPSMPMKLSGLQTGKGKTNCAIECMCTKKVTTAIILGEGIDQWKERILETTTLTPDDIYVIQSEKSLTRLFCNLHLRPKVFLISIATLRLWAFAAGPGSTYINFPTWHQFCDAYGIGLKIHDEIHRKFLTNVYIDLMSEIEDNVYLSATPARTVKKENRIFTLVFPPDIRFDGPEYDSYVGIFFYYYTLHTKRKPGAFRTIKGYSQDKYEKILMTNRDLLYDFTDEVLYPLINDHYMANRKEGQKCLVLANKKETVFTLVQQIRREYPELRVTKYMGGVSRDVLKDNDIIVATHKSASTALDIKNLLVCINIVSFNSQVTTEQMLGRLRKLKDGTTPHLVDMCNVVLHDHQRHARQRCAIYRELGQDLVERTLT